MKIGELNQRCGDCHLINLCGEPYDEVCLCTNSKLSEMSEQDYIAKVEDIRKYQKRNWSNKSLMKIITHEK